MQMRLTTALGNAAIKADPLVICHMKLGTCSHRTAKLIQAQQEQAQGRNSASVSGARATQMQVNDPGNSIWMQRTFLTTKLLCSLQTTEPAQRDQRDFGTLKSTGV